MKTVTLAILMALSGLSTYAQSNITDYTGTARISLNYFDLGWGCSKEDTLDSYTLGWITLGVIPAIATVMCPDLADPDYGTFDVKVSASVNEVGNNRASVVLTSQTKKHCAGFSFSLLGEADDFGNYELYKSNDDYVSGKSIGRMIKQADRLILDIPSATKIFTPGKEGKQCTWNLDQGLNLHMGLNK